MAEKMKDGEKMKLWPLRWRASAIIKDTEDQRDQRARGG